MVEPLKQLAEFLARSTPLVKSAAFFLAWGLLWLPIALPLSIALQWRPPQPLAVGQKIPLVLSLYALAPLLLWGSAQVEGVGLSSYGIVWSLPELGWFGLGLLLGVGGIGLLFGLECAIGWASWQRSQPSQLASVVLPTLILGTIVSAVEEPIFRGFLLDQLQQDYSGAVAAIGASLVFAVLHLVWDGKSALPQLPGLWLMGMVLVLARWVDDGNLGLACGLHAGWVWAMASLDAAQTLRYTDRGPTWMTGLAGQPLAGGMSLLLLLLTGGVIWRIAGWV